MKNALHLVERIGHSQSEAKGLCDTLFGGAFGDAPLANATPKPSLDESGPLLAYVLVASVEDTVTQTRRLGGKIIVDKTPIPEMGAFAVIASPAGGVVGVFETRQ